MQREKNKLSQLHVRLITQTEEHILRLVHKSTRIITLWKSGWWGASPSLPKNQRRMCFSQKNLLHNKKRKLSSCAISGARKCQPRNIMNQIISLCCHIASFTQSWDVNHVQWERALPYRQSMSRYDNSSWQGESGLMSRKNNSRHKKKLLTDWAPPGDDCKEACPPCRMMELVNVIRIICFHFVKEGELMNKESHCIFRDTEHQCQWDVSGTSFPSSINLWTGGHEPETPATHYWFFLISHLVLFDPISCYAPSWLLCPLEIAKSFILMLWFTVIVCLGLAR